MNFKKILGYAMVTIFCLAIMGAIVASLGLIPAAILVGGAFLGGAFLATGMNLIDNN